MRQKRSDVLSLSLMEKKTFPDVGIRVKAREFPKKEQEKQQKYVTNCVECYEIK